MKTGRSNVIQIRSQHKSASFEHAAVFQKDSGESEISSLSESRNSTFIFALIIFGLLVGLLWWVLNISPNEQQSIGDERRERTLTL